MNKTSPNWGLLPNNPLAFFGLEVSFDRKDLKRSYGKLIKKFKPETHPAEFQRIREAYEVLESQNRYGVQQAALSQLTAAWDLGHSSSENSRTEYSSSTSSSDNANATSDVASETDAAIADPTTAYRTLSKRQNRSPQHYYLLATLSDIVDHQTKSIYLKWLLTGVREHPQDPGLLKLLSEYLSGFADLNIAASTLLTLSKLVDGADFFRVTEKLWDRLLDEIPFESFAKTLNACEKNLKYTNLRPRLAFYTHILRRSIFRAPEEWLAQRWKFVEAHGSELDASLDDDIEFLSLVLEYKKQDRVQLLKKPIGKSIDRLIESYCKDTSLHGMAEVALICDELARNGNGVMDSFPSSQDESNDRVLLLCAIISGTVAEESGLDFGRVNVERIQQQADAAVSDLRKTIDSVATRINLMRYRHFGIPFLVIWLGPLIATLGIPYWPFIVLAWSAIAILGFLGVVKPMWLEKKAEEKTHKVLIKEYEAQWRPRLIRYVQACHSPSQHSINQLLQSARDLGQSQIIEIILSYGSGDRALHLLNQLQLFVH